MLATSMQVFDGKTKISDKILIQKIEDSKVVLLIETEHMHHKSNFRQILTDSLLILPTVYGEVMNS